MMNKMYNLIEVEVVIQVKRRPRSRDKRWDIVELIKKGEREE
jgi:ribosomal protein S17